MLLQDRDMFHRRTVLKSRRLCIDEQSQMVGIVDCILGICVNINSRLIGIFLRNQQNREPQSHQA